ncbi:siderophore-interacting protein [Yinghuangia sp. ASG 101]|uniref:siderophore-interacting protein n=1 Tax=Yinghuangia sp. ASG 101 TaxID=2896848 RepID=UPI001E35224E|nr:siderophore-interacting protein [Yinghuangia sp. ASG 101]UGQ11403.1 siderophore-interacting protein [Yinghuangia sp. ASG 101]
MAGDSRGWQGAVLKAMRAPDYTLTVTGKSEITPHFLRVSFTAGGMLSEREIHPTHWVRLWFPNGKGALQQRGYTLVNPDSAHDSVDIDFALHEGMAANWAAAVEPGATITATVMGSKFALPTPAPTGYVIVGDTASLPAIRTLLAAIGDAPARVWLEWQHEDDRSIPLPHGDSAEVTWVRRADSGAALVAAVRAAAVDSPHHFGWVACEARTTRAVVAVLRDDFKIDKRSVKSQAYWVSGGLLGRRKSDS